jgi:hypothetical protein|uniref:Uncharacterized protein n=1 Tax=viral metagenome TaxID=1070528 RepID=A0A6C0JCI4_9ZZZZ|tara:strand:- start:110 stop:367 length:258 start_codon:yes stop_codon:yes gene_type:complete
MFRAMYKDPKFIGAQITPPNNVIVITEDGVENYTVEKQYFRSEALIDKQMKLLKGTDRGKNKLRELFLEPRIEQKGRFTVTVYEF